MTGRVRHVIPRPLHSSGPYNKVGTNGDCFVNPRRYMHFTLKAPSAKRAQLTFLRAEVQKHGTTKCSLGKTCAATCLGLGRRSCEA